MQALLKKIGFGGDAEVPIFFLMKKKQVFLVILQCQYVKKCAELLTTDCTCDVMMTSGHVL